MIGEIEVLPKLFDQVLIPPAVFAELSHPHAPESVSTWLADAPNWLRVQPPSCIQDGLNLDAGETEAISLVLELKPLAILIDEKRGREAARRYGVVPIGILSILDVADRRGFLDFKEAIGRLRLTNFRVAPKLLDSLLEEARKRG